MLLATCGTPPCQEVQVRRADHGFGLVAGIGFERWVASKASVGVLLRLQIFDTELIPHGSDGSKHSFVVPAFLVTATAQ